MPDDPRPATTPARALYGPTGPRGPLPDYYQGHGEARETPDDAEAMLAAKRRDPPAVYAAKWRRWMGLR